MNSSRALTAAEKKVLFAFIEKAMRSDAAVAERTHLKESTVRTCRQNLVNDGHLRFVNFPAFHKFGCDLVASYFGDTNLVASMEEKESLHKTFFRKNPEVVDAVMSTDLIAFLGIFRGFSDFLLFWDRHNSLFKGSWMPRSAAEPALFPIEISRWQTGYNFAPCLKRILKLDLESPVLRMPQVLEKRNIKLSMVERETFMEMIDYPNATDAVIAQDVGRSRARITELTNRFTKAGLCEHIGVPSMTSPEFGVTAYVHLKFCPDVSFEEKLSIAGDDWWKQSCCTHHRDSEVSAVYPFADIKECVSLLKQYIGPFKSEGVLVREPDVRVVSEDTSTDIVDSSFARLMHKLILT